MESDALLVALTLARNAGTDVAYDRAVPAEISVFRSQLVAE